MTENSAIATLRREHDAILRMLDASDELGQSLEHGTCIPPEMLSRLLEFFQLFADRCHHGKEEELLFPLLQKRGLPREEGPIAIMLDEHEQGRHHVREMAAAGEAYAAGAKDAGLRWAMAAREYANLLRWHIAKENNVLFPMAERLLTDSDQQELATGFEQIEEEKMGAGTHQRLHVLMDELLAEIRREKN